MKDDDASTDFDCPGDFFDDLVDHNDDNNNNRRNYGDEEITIEQDSEINADFPMLDEVLPDKLHDDEDIEDDTVSSAMVNNIAEMSATKQKTTFEFFSSANSGTVADKYGLKIHGDQVIWESIKDTPIENDDLKPLVGGACWAWPSFQSCASPGRARASIQGS